MGSSLWVGPADEPDAYQLVESLGAGGEGEVWRGIRPLSEAGASRTIVAIKTFGSAADEPATPSWSRHVSLLQALRHPGIVRVVTGFVGPGRHWAGEADRSGSAERYLVMEYVEGTPLADWCVAHRGATFAQRARMIRQVATALDYLHSGADTNGVEVAHGDIKPGNLLVQDEGRVILVDFGLANLADGAAKLGMGTPGYLAPELIAAGHRARPTPDGDRYALAATLVYLLTGQSPPPLLDTHGQPVDADREATRRALEACPSLRDLSFVADLVLEGLAGDPAARPRSLTRWLAEVGSRTVTNPPSPNNPNSPSGLDHGGLRSADQTTAWAAGVDSPPSGGGGLSTAHAVPNPGASADRRRGLRWPRVRRPARGSPRANGSR